VSQLASLFNCAARRTVRLLLLSLLGGVAQDVLFSQPRCAAQTRNLPSSTYHLLNAQQPPGAVARAQIVGRKPGAGTFTAVSIIAPKGTKVGLAKEGQFLEPIDAPVTTGMLVGAVYRFRVTSIPDRPGDELFPSLEVIDRTYAEPGREHRFPIPVVLDAEDLSLALQGAMVTRVIYLEDSQNAVPVATSPDQQQTINVSPTENALRTADALGRPVAILRIGSRVPTDLNGDLSGFMHGCPPWVPLPTAPNPQQMIRDGLWPEVVPATRPKAIYSEDPIENYPRLPQGR
jgi:hypothetical protein